MSIGELELCVSAPAWFNSHVSQLLSFAAVSLVDQFSNPVEPNVPNDGYRILSFVGD